MRELILEFGFARFEIPSSIESNATENRRGMEKGYFLYSLSPDRWNPNEKIKENSLE